MISITNKSNYLAKIVKLQGVRKHSNADRLQCVDIDFQTVITGMDAKDGDVYVYFPAGTKLYFQYLSDTNSFSDKELNVNKEEKGYFNSKGVVKATRLRGEKSYGYIVDAYEFGKYFGYESLHLHINEEFDTVNNIVVCEKYVIPAQKSSQRKGRQPIRRISRLVDNQFRFHEDTENLRKNVHKLNINDHISISYKLHGTSVIISHVLVKRKLGILTRLLSNILSIEKTKYDLVYASRRVVKNQYLEDDKNKNHFYNQDIWKQARNRYSDKIPKGFTLYGEIVGQLNTGQWIQKNYDYGLEVGRWEMYVYRITFTNVDGHVFELSTSQMIEFCNKQGLKYPPQFFNGTVSELLESMNMETDRIDYENLIRKLEDKYNEKNCFMCKNAVPEEGIVIRKEKLNEFEAYKLKSFNFLEMESKFNESNIEDQN